MAPPNDTNDREPRKPGWKVGGFLILHRFDEHSTFKAEVELWSNSEFPSLAMEKHGKKSGFQRWNMRLDRAAVGALTAPPMERNAFRRWVGKDIQSFTYSINHGKGGVATDIVGDQGQGDTLARFEFAPKKVALIISACANLHAQCDKHLGTYDEMAEVLAAAKAKAKEEAEKKEAAKTKKLEEEQKAKEEAAPPVTGEVNGVVTMVSNPTPNAAETEPAQANANAS